LVADKSVTPEKRAAGHHADSEQILAETSAIWAKANTPARLTDVRFWHLADKPTAPEFVGYRGMNARKTCAAPGWGAAGGRVVDAISARETKTARELNQLINN